MGDDHKKQVTILSWEDQPKNVNLDINSHFLFSCCFLEISISICYLDSIAYFKKLTEEDQDLKRIR
jgi:hypothetical protein